MPESADPAQPAVRGLSPLLLTSPTIRSGTTLLQRLLCTASNAVVYGEEVGKDLDIQLQIFASRRLVYANARPDLVRRLDQVIQGTADDWILDLMPDLDGYVQALHDGALAGLVSCHEHANSLGRALWGFKYPGWPPHMLRLMSDCVPGTRVICIVRDLGDTARSAKAWGAFQDEAGLRVFCAQWLAHLRFLRDWQREHAVLMLRLEDVIADPEAAFARLRGFLPFEGLQAGPIGQRINQPVAADGRAHYRPPATLTAQEQAWVDETVAAAGVY